MTTKDLYLNLWIYGEPGTGKTTFAAGALDHPALGPALFINIEGGLLSVAGRGDIDAVEIQTPEDIDRITYAILTRHPAYAHYKTIVVDSLTELQSISLSTIVAAAMLKAPGRDRSIDDIEIGDYGKSSTQMKRLIGALRNAPVHVIFTGLAKRDYPKGADPKLVQPTAVGPSLTSKLADHAMGMMDFVWFMYMDEQGQRTILTQSFNQFKAKTRGPRFAEAMGMTHVNPHLPTLYDLLIESEANYNGNSAPTNLFSMNPTMGTEVQEAPGTVGNPIISDQIPSGLQPMNEAPLTEVEQIRQEDDVVFAMPGVSNNPSPVGSPFSAVPVTIGAMPIPSSTPQGQS